MVDTEGVRDHVTKARALALPHVSFFDEAFEKDRTTPVPELMRCVDELLAKEASEFAAREWRFSEWRAQQAAGPPATSATKEARFDRAPRHLPISGLPPRPSSSAVCVGAAIAAAAFAAGATVGARVGGGSR